MNRYSVFSFVLLLMGNAWCMQEGTTREVHGRVYRYRETPPAYFSPSRSYPFDAVLSCPLSVSDINQRLSCFVSKAINLLAIDYMSNNDLMYLANACVAAHVLRSMLCGHEQSTGQSRLTSSGGLDALADATVIVTCPTKHQGICGKLRIDWRPESDRPSLLGWFGTLPQHQKLALPEPVSATALLLPTYL